MKYNKKRTYIVVGRVAERDDGRVGDAEFSHMQGGSGSRVGGGVLRLL